MKKFKEKLKKSASKESIRNGVKWLFVFAISFCITIMGFSVLVKGFTQVSVA